jgi:hypothetical protein
MASAVIATTQQPDPPATLLGETYGYWTQTVVLLAAAFLAYMSIKTARAIERRKAAASALFSSKKDEELTQAIRHVAQLHDGDKKIGPLARKEHFDSDDAKRIKYALNHYEYVSVGILYGIYDEAIYKASSYTTIVKLYERTKPFIDEARKVTGSPTTYQEFECLACRWQNKPLQHKQITAVQKRGLLRRN